MLSIEALQIKIEAFLLEHAESLKALQEDSFWYAECDVISQKNGVKLTGEMLRELIDYVAEKHAQ